MSYTISNLRDITKHDMLFSLFSNILLITFTLANTFVVLDQRILYPRKISYAYRVFVIPEFRYKIVAEVFLMMCLQTKYLDLPYRNGQLLFLAQHLYRIFFAQEVLNLFG